MKEERLWILLAKKLAAEASDKELQELKRLLYNDPVMQKNVRLVTAFWHLKLRTVGTDKEAAFEKLWKKIKDGSFL